MTHVFSEEADFSRSNVLFDFMKLKFGDPVSDDNGPILAYLAQQFRIRVEISRAHVKNSPKPPKDLIQRAQSKLDQVKASGKIDFYEIYEDLLISTWSKLHSATKLPDNYKISFTLGSGAPKLISVAVEKGPNDKTPLIVKATPHPDAKNWHRSWVKATILHQARKLGITQPIAASGLQACIRRILSGAGTPLYRLSLSSSFSLDQLKDKLFVISANKTKGEIAIIVNDVIAAANPKNLESIHTAATQAIEKLKQTTGLSFQYHKQEVSDYLQGAAKGPESLGIGTPLFILAATAPVTHIPVATSASAIPAQKADTAIQTFFELEISKDKMKAIIKRFKIDVYSNPKLALDRAWFEGQLKALGVSHGFNDTLWKTVEEALLSKETLDGITAAKGTAPTPGVDPYIHLVYKDPPKDTDPSKMIDIREAQQRNLVRPGQQVAEIRFKTPAKLGLTITGENVPAPKPVLAVTIGEGIQQNVPGEFYAIVEGLPVCDNISLSITKIFIHKGDVNLKSGNIRFDGPVEIQGSVDDGATVDVGGPLIIQGMVRAAFIYSKTTVEIKQGVVTTDKGFIKARGDITADFIENSRIQCGGVLRADKAILNSEIFAQKCVMVTSTNGIIGGGTISAREALFAPNLGFPGGAKTILIIGADAKALQRVAARTLRAEKIKAAADRYRNEIREFATKRNAQMTQKHQEKKLKLQKLISKVKVTIEKSDNAVLEAKGLISYNSNAIIAVSNKMSTNCQIEIGSIAVPVMSENLGVAITTKKRKDEHICSIEDAKADIDRLLAAYGTPKAS
jgi:uncharacterized protein (DUF342 family)